MIWRFQDDPYSADYLLQIPVVSVAPASQLVAAYFASVYLASVLAAVSRPILPAQYPVELSATTAPGTEITRMPIMQLRSFGRATTTPRSHH